MRRGRGARRRGSRLQRGASDDRRAQQAAGKRFRLKAEAHVTALHRDAVDEGLRISCAMPGSAISFSIASISTGAKRRQVLVARRRDQDHVLEPDVDAVLGNRQRRLDREDHPGLVDGEVLRDVVDFHADHVPERRAGPRRRQRGAR